MIHLLSLFILLQLPLLLLVLYFIFQGSPILAEKLCFQINQKLPKLKLIIHNCWHPTTNVEECLLHTLHIANNNFDCKQ